jgi:hypothetical protein
VAQVLEAFFGHSFAPPIRAIRSNSTPIACFRLPEPAPLFSLKMATSVFAETLVNSQHSTLLTPESRSYTSACCDSVFGRRGLSTTRDASAGVDGVRQSLCVKATVKDIQRLVTQWDSCLITGGDFE